MRVPAPLLPSDPFARRVGMTLGAVTVTIVGIFVAVFSLNKLTPMGEWRELVDIGAEANIPTWWNVTLLILVATAAIAAAGITPESSPATRRAWWVVAAAAAYASIDEAAALHERLAGPVQDLNIDLPTFAWLLPGTVLAIGGAAILVVAGRRLPQPTAGRLGIALASYGSAAVGIEAVNGWIRDRRDDSIFYTLGTIIEESVEMGACVYAVTAVLDTFSWRRTGAGLTVGIPPT